MKKKFIISIHILFWIIFIFNELKNESSLSEAFTSPLFYSGIFVNFIVFYFNYFVILPKVVLKKKLSFLIIGLLSAFIIFISFRYLIQEFLFPTFLGYGNYFKGTTLVYYVFDNLYWASNVVFISSLIWFLKYSFTIANENEILLKEKNHAQLQALKSQINPHFIFNSLNNIYSLVYQKSDNALMAIEELSQLLRYSTKDLEKDHIPLEKEIGYIHSLIALEKLRIKNPELLIVEKKLNHPNLEISPMILVPFVENAFKHGDFDEKGLILKINDNDEKLHFYLHNFKKQKVKDVISGIGIDNVKKRLEILNPKNHELKITESEDEFIVDLKINLK
jgi:two-component system LytT family sensor kinase